MPRAKGSWYERKFYSINLIQQDADTIVSKFIDFLSKQNVTSSKAEDSAKKNIRIKAKKQIIKKSLPQAWNTLLSSEDESLIDLFNNMLEKISGYRAESEDIAEFLEKNRARLLIFEEQPTQVTKRTREIEHLPQMEEEKTSNYVRTGFTGKGINAFIFNNKKYEAKSWKQLLLTICDEVNNLHKKDFEKVFSLKGRKKTLFYKKC